MFDNIRCFFVSRILRGCVLLFFAFCLLCGGHVFSKELTNRLGIGGRQNFAIGVGELVASYYPTSELGVVGGLGVDTRENNSQFSFNAELRRILFKENNMNFFMSGKVGMVNNEVAGQKNSGYELSALFGGEFFFQGLDSLGFIFQAGAGILSMSTVRFMTFGNTPIHAGMIFYF